MLVQIWAWNCHRCLECLQQPTLILIGRNHGAHLTTMHATKWSPLGQKMASFVSMICILCIVNFQCLSMVTNYLIGLACNSQTKMLSCCLTSHQCSNIVINCMGFTDIYSIEWFKQFVSPANSKEAINCAHKEPSQIKWIWIYSTTNLLYCKRPTTFLPRSSSYKIQPHSHLAQRNYN